MLEKAIDEQDLGHRLADPYQISGPIKEDARSSLLPIYVHELFDVFPHWGDRLYSILQEVAEPTPMSWHEKWSDRRKSPRYMYWAGVFVRHLRDGARCVAGLDILLQLEGSKCWLGLSNKECFCSTDRTRSIKQTARVVLALCTLDEP